MKHEFWHKRWENDQIGFHAPGAHRYLQNNWGAMELDSSETVFVPLCGKSLDLIWLLENGHSVIGVELSGIAIEAFFLENQLEPRKSREGEFIVWTAGPIKLYEGDFFSLESAHLKGVGAFYDRAALVALPPEMRQAYVSHLKKIIPALKKGLLISFTYQQDEMNGPPFSVPAEEINKSYSPHWNVESLRSEDVLPLNRHFEKRGLSRLEELAYRITPES